MKKIAEKKVFGKNKRSSTELCQKIKYNSRIFKGKLCFFFKLLNRINTQLLI